MKWRYVIWGLIAMSALIVADFTLVQWYRSHAKWNVIVISIDSLRADHMSLYGYARETTPAIDAWARESVVFDNFFPAAYLTPIAEMAVQTGMYPIRSGVINFDSYLRGTVETLAEVLRREGYQTVAIGSSPEFNISALFSGFSRGFDQFNLRRGEERRIRTSSPAIDDALWWLQKGRKKSVPFYLWIHIGSVHWPYGGGFGGGEPLSPHFTDQSYSGFLKTAGSNFPEPYGFIYESVRYASSSPYGRIGAVSDADIGYVNDRYDDGILDADTSLGELLAYLDRSGLINRTIVVLQSEHGESLGERGYIAHYDLYDEQVHTPLIVRMPDVSPRRVVAVASGVDIAPTIADALGITHDADGVSWLPYLSHASTTPPRTEVFLTRTPLWERIVSYGYPLGEAFRAEDDEKHFFDTAIRSTEWKLIHRSAREAERRYAWWGWLTGKPVGRDEYELYDLARDSDESTNVYSQKQDDAGVVELQHKLDEWETEMRRSLPAPTPADTIQEYF